MTPDSEDAARTRARALLTGPRRRQQQRADHLVSLITHVDQIQALETALAQTMAALIDLGLSPAEIVELTGVPQEKLPY